MKLRTTPVFARFAHGALVVTWLSGLGCTARVAGTQTSGGGAGGSTPSSTGTGASTTGTGASVGTTDGGSTGGTTVASCSETTATLAKPHIWRLTHTQVANTLRDKVGFVPPAVNTFPGEARLEGFANRASQLKVSPLLADSYYKASEELAAQAVASPTAFGITCAVANIATGTCLRTFITTLGQKMWRRPLVDSEITGLTTLYTTTAGQGEGPAGGVKGVVQAMLLSPNFLHRSEVGTSQVAGALTSLTDYELASALSYTLWDTAPDDALLEQARMGKLRDKAVLASEAKRLLGLADKASPALHHFVQQWMFIEDLPRSDKDMTLFPLGTLEVAADLMEENRLFMNSVLFDAGGDRSFKTLLTASYGFVNSRTAPLYGLQGVTGTKLTRRELNANERRGIFSLPSFMWSHANSDGTHLVDRGAYFRAEVLCDRVPAPPGGIIQQAKFAPADATGREKFAVHSEPACAGCHKLFDGLGFAMEGYDAIGRFRLTENGKTIDASGAIPLPSAPSGPDLQFTNFVDLVNKLAEKPDVYSCFATQYLTYVSGRDTTEIPRCEKVAIADSFVKADYKVDALISSVIGSPNFIQRQN